MRVFLERNGKEGKGKGKERVRLGGLRKSAAGAPVYDYDFEDLWLG